MTITFLRTGRLALIGICLLASQTVLSNEASEAPDQPSITVTEGYTSGFQASSPQLGKETLLSRHRGEFRQFDIFHIDTLLFSDFDNDGFFSSFDLTFDLDVEYGQALVFADIWIRRYGGYYELLYTTDTFVIEGQNAYDEYHVSTDLLEDFPRDYYDILIELYDVDYSLVEPVAIADASIDSSLSALPLESRYKYYGGSSVVISASGAGSMSGFLPALLSLTLLRLARRRKP